MDLRDLDRRALAQTGGFLAGITLDQLDRPTPCTGWSLRDLLVHLVANNHGWARAAGGAPSEREIWEEASLGDDPYRAFLESATAVNEAFAVDDLMARTFDVYGYGVFPAGIALGMHFVDYLVHGWDVARSLGVPAEFDEELSRAALQIALRWPYRRPDKAFDVKVEVSDQAPTHERLVGYLGRSPTWPW